MKPNANLLLARLADKLSCKPEELKFLVEPDDPIKSVEADMRIPDIEETD